MLIVSLTIITIIYTTAELGGTRRQWSGCRIVSENHVQGFRPVGQAQETDTSDNKLVGKGVRNNRSSDRL